MRFLSAVSAGEDASLALALELARAVVPDEGSARLALDVLARGEFLFPTAIRLARCVLASAEPTTATTLTAAAVGAPIDPYPEEGATNDARQR